MLLRTLLQFTAPLAQLNLVDSRTSGPLASLSGIQLCRSRGSRATALRVRPTIWPADSLNVQGSQATKTPPPNRGTLT